MRFAKFRVIEWLAAAALVLAGPVAFAAAAIVKSPNDARDYLGFTLPNQLRVLVISDPQTDKAAASLDVNVGSGADPGGRDGLAHLLEHMLFLGTEKYPDSGEYKAFIASHGGSDNAYTALDHTNYYFDVEQQFLEPALDRFAQFFVAPLFTAAYVDRERQVVHSEYQSKLRNDGWRVRSAQKRLVNPRHPYGGFGVGSATTLADRDGKSIREELLAFYRRYYSANLMTLVVLGKESTEQLRRWVEEKFSPVPDHAASAPTISEPLFEPGTLPARLDVVPIKSTHSLTLAFPVPAVTGYYRVKPLRYIGSLLGHEGKGSLLSLLKTQGWADSLWAGPLASHQDAALYGVSIELSEQGFEQVDAVIDQVFQMLRLIERDGIQRWQYEEQRQLADIDFRFQEERDPLHAVRSLAGAMHELPLHDLLRGPYAMDSFDAELIRRYLGDMTPDNVLVTLVGPGVAATAESRDPWFQAAYRVTPIAAELREQWAGGVVEPRLALARPNEFIPQQLPLHDAAGAGTKPELIRSRRGFEFWHQQDGEFRIPRAELYFSIRSPVANDTPRDAMLTELVVRLANDQLAEFTYPAYLAGLSYQLYKHLRGISVRISGYDAQQSRLLERILDTLANLEFDPARFDAIKDDLRRGLANSREEAPYRQAYREIMNLLMVPSWTDDEQAEALEQLTIDAVREFVPRLFAQVSVVGLAYGNVDRRAALEMAELLSRRLLGSAEPATVARGSSVKLGGGADFRRSLTLDHNDSALLVYLQGADQSLRSRAGFALLGQLIETPFFEDLRTENKLGYIVSANQFPIFETPGLAFVVQSPIADPAELQTHVDRFLNRFGEQLDALSEGEFKRNQSTVIGQIMRSEKTLQDRAKRYWAEIDREEYRFDSRERLAAAVAALDLATVQGLFHRLVLGDERRRLVIGSTGQVHAGAPTSGRPAVVSRSETIDDPAAFKLGHSLFPG